jgi:pimeloyl-ACP methyl ester carboxylesterase
MIERIKAPVTLVYGDGSHAGSEAARGALDLPGARRVILPGGHNLHFEAPGELADLIASSRTVDPTCEGRK